MVCLKQTAILSEQQNPETRSNYKPQIRARRQPVFMTKSRARQAVGRGCRDPGGGEWRECASFLSCLPQFFRALAPGLWPPCCAC